MFLEDARRWDQDRSRLDVEAASFAVRIDTKSLSTVASELTLLDRELRRLLAAQDELGSGHHRYVDLEAFRSRVLAVDPVPPADSDLSLDRVQNGSFEAVVGGAVTALASDPATALVQLGALVGGVYKVVAFVRNRWRPDAFGRDALDKQSAGEVLYSNEKTGERFYGTRAVITRSANGVTEQIILERSTLKP